MSYNPTPPRVWSRVQNPCTYTDASNNSDINYNQIYIPLTGQTITQSQANYEEKLIYKGNILQYKGNSSRLTKSQQYTQLAKGFGPNRKKIYATQSQTYTNPNTTILQRVNYKTYPYPNQIVGAPNNPSGPFQYNVANPDNCSGVSIQDGGRLVCGTYANPCTGDIIKQGIYSASICNPSSASDVPGSTILCWNNKVQTWFTKPRYVMNNSTDKWPVNYKKFVSAVPIKLLLHIISNNCSSVTLGWNRVINCIQITSYNIYQNGILVQNVPYTTLSTTINALDVGTLYSFYITSVSNTSESLISNTVLLNTPSPSFTATGTYSYTTDSNCNYTITFTGNGTIRFSDDFNINVIAVGGGGGGGGGSTYNQDNPTESAGGGGGGGGIGILNNFTITQTINYSITIGTYGIGGEGNNHGISGSESSFKNGVTNYLTALGGGGGGGYYNGCQGGSGGTATSITTITSYNGGNGGNGFQAPYGSPPVGGITPTSGSNTNPLMPIGPVPSGLTYYFSGGGGGGIYNPTFNGGLAGNNGNGGTFGGNSVTNGENASLSSYGSGGGGGGCPPSYLAYSNGGNGTAGVVIIYFTH